MKLRYILILMTCLLMLGCTEDMSAPDINSSQLIRLTSNIDELAVTRVDDGGFTNGDIIGVYVVNYNGSNPGTLLPAGNHADNVLHTYTNNSWKPNYDIYWKDKQTHVDIYGYYPYANPQSIDSYPFTVHRDQTATVGTGTMGGYEASDFLWGKVSDVAPTNQVIRLPLHHRMASARVTLVEGEGFSEGEWSSLEKIVLATNLVRQASIDLSTGIVTPNGEIEKSATIPVKKGTEWRAIVVPQTVKAGTTMFSITLSGIPYTFSKNEDFTYTAGRMSNFSIRVDKKIEEGIYKLTCTGESITLWENDPISHDAQAREYIVIDCPSAGGLASAIKAANKDYSKIKNMKVTGSINETDCKFMNEQMTSLSSLNLKEANISFEGKSKTIPDIAFSGCEHLTHITLPDKLTTIGNSAFYGCNNLLGTLIIPEGVTTIKTFAFANCNSLSALSLPSTLKRIEHNAFYECNFICELILPDALAYIGESAFGYNQSLYGNLVLPDNLTFLGTSAFLNCDKLTGTLRIPQKLHEIPEQAFERCGFDGNLFLHDGIENIGRDAFDDCNFQGELVLPKNLTTVNVGTFRGNYFSGTLKLPASVMIVKTGAFYGNNFSGTLEIPERVESIQNQAFMGNEFEEIILPASLSTIGNQAFDECYYISKIVAKNYTPLYIQDQAFSGNVKDNAILEVPEAAISQYQTAPEWCDFKRITAHHQLLCYPNVIRTLGSEHSQTIIVEAESDWEIKSKPDWCELSPASGYKKTEVAVTVKGSATASDRTGKIVIGLKDKRYTYTLNVEQYGYKHAEDEFITLQTATNGNGDINIVFLGDGFDAKDISSKKYLDIVKEQMNYFFAIEPFTTYRNYFNVYAGISLSNEHGISSASNMYDNRFSTTYTGNGYAADYAAIFDYAAKAPAVTADNLKQTLIIVVPNNSEYGGGWQLWPDGRAIVFTPTSEKSYPNDTRGIVQHNACGHGFGKLGDEHISHNAFAPDKVISEIRNMQSFGFYENLDLTGKMHQAAWSHLIFDARYSGKVDIFDGAYGYTRGVYRSEQNSCMNNSIPYFNTISRESIVRRIKRYADESFTFEDFVKNDNANATVQ